MQNKKDSDMLMVLRDRDIFPNVTDDFDIVWKDRHTGKVVLFNNENQIALIGNKVNDFFLLPGGVEENESLIEGIKRECQEETGCETEIEEALGMTEDFRTRDGKHYINHGYIAKVISQGVAKFTGNEINIGAYVKWIPLVEAVILFAQQEEMVKAGGVKFYNTCFNIFRDSFFIHRAQDFIQKKDA
jgi:ADP-ribose pyrophosphatase YjhB (NUDIX family)